MEFLAPFHPKVVHYPIALLTLYPLIMGIFAVTGKEFFNKVSLLLLTLGVIASVFALLTGNAAATINNATAVTPAQPALDDHIFFANATVWFFSALLILQFRYYVLYTVKNKQHNSKRTMPYLLLVLSLAGLFFVQQTGFHGGKMVYNFGIGVFRSTPVPAPTQNDTLKVK